MLSAYFNRYVTLRALWANFYRICYPEQPIPNGEDILYEISTVVLRQRILHEVYLKGDSDEHMGRLKKAMGSAYGGGIFIVTLLTFQNYFTNSKTV